MSAHLFNAAEDGESEVRLPRLLRRDTTDHASAVRECLFYMESTLTSRQGQKEWSSIKVYETHSLSRETLAKNLRVLVDEEVGDGQVVITAGRRLRERPAPS